MPTLTCRPTSASTYDSPLSPARRFGLAPSMTESPMAVMLSTPSGAVMPVGVVVGGGASVDAGVSPGATVVGAVVVDDSPRSRSAIAGSEKPLAPSAGPEAVSCPASGSFGGGSSPGAGGSCPSPCS